MNEDPLATVVEISVRRRFMTDPPITVTMHPDMGRWTANVVVFLIKLGAALGILLGVLFSLLSLVWKDLWYAAYIVACVPAEHHYQHKIDKIRRVYAKRTVSD